MTFAERCYMIVKKVPKGKVVTYKRLAQKMHSKGYRAVGNALNKNLCAEVPCHRVVRSNGDIGGFARGKKQKQKILEKEGVYISHGKIDLVEYGYFQ
jgi:methylated-DNA-[protein]-cysteine S-methyltransferase